MLSYCKLNIANCKLPAAFLLIASCVLFSCKSTKISNIEKTEPEIKLFEVLKDQDGSKMLRGILFKEQITQDTSFKWYAKNVKLTKPNADAVTAVAAKADKISIVIFGGTWCEDTHQLLPKYLSLLQAAQFPDDRLMLVAVDRAKTTVTNLQKIFNVTNVPTCIVLKDGKEVGRIVEFGKTTFVDKELGEMVAAIQ